jgi:hypothetical protein
MKGAATAILIFFVMLVAFVPTGIVPACATEGGGCFVLLDNTAVHAEPDSASAVLITLQKDTQIAISDTQITDNIKWYSTVCNGRTGYVRADAVYQKYLAQSYTIRYAHVSSTKKNEDIYICSAPTEDAQKLFELHDGMRVILTGYESDGYLEIICHDIKGFIPRENIVINGLTYRQYLAFLVGVVCMATVLMIFVLSRVNRKKEEKT